MRALMLACGLLALSPGASLPAPVLYQVGSSEEDLPECSNARAVCSRLDVYERPWLEHQCRCPGSQSCPVGLSTADGRTIADKSRLLKLCTPVRTLPRCQYFTDVTWTIVTDADNTSQQVVNCHCPGGGRLPGGAASPAASPRLQYSFACSPHSKLRCRRKEPCRLFTVRKRQGLVEEANVSTLCRCPLDHSCPAHHTDRDVVQSHAYPRDTYRVFSGYCTPH